MFRSPSECHNPTVSVKDERARSSDRSGALVRSHYRRIVRGIMLKGAGLATLWQETLVLVGMTALLLARGSRGLAIRLG